MTSKAPDVTPLSLFEEIFPGDTNAYGTAFGGKILALMDRAAGLAASRFAHCHFVTVALDALDFRAPVRQGEIAEIEAQVVYASPHTCGMKVRVYALDKTRWLRRPCCDGMIFMVAIGPDGKTRKVPPFQPSGAAARREWADAQAIHQRLKKR